MSAGKRSGSVKNRDWVPFARSVVFLLFLSCLIIPIPCRPPILRFFMFSNVLSAFFAPHATVPAPHA